MATDGTPPPTHRVELAAVLTATIKILRGPRYDGNADWLATRLGVIQDENASEADWEAARSELNSIVVGMAASTTSYSMTKPYKPSLTASPTGSTS